MHSSGLDDQPDEEDTLSRLAVMGMLVCQECGATSNVKQHACRTSYHYDEEEKKAGKTDPNPDPILCEMCAQEYNQHWNEMWAEYYSSQGLYNRQSD